MSERGKERSKKKKEAFRLAMTYTKELLEPYKLYCVSKDMMHRCINQSTSRVKENSKFSRLHKVASIHAGNLGLGNVETILMKSNCEYLINMQKGFALLHRIKDSRGLVNTDVNIIISIEEAEALTALRDLPDMVFKLKYHRFR
jgi:hypothetical protein